MELSSILHLSDFSKYKLHAARKSGTVEPLIAFLRDRSEWHQWNSWQRNKNEFNRDRILSLIDFYPEHGEWLFGGIYEVQERGPEKNAHSYVVKLLDHGQDLIGRLKLTGSLPRGRAFKLETFYDNFKISELLRTPYAGKVFDGYEKVSLDLSMLEIIYKNNRTDWKTALESVKGIYLIADKLTGKQYVGSAYGDTGIWARWACYVNTGHGWNKELVKLTSNDPSYARTNFKITLIECWPFKTDDKTIIIRENFWKEAFLTKQHGYNSN
ncbi:GIY-YIG nuclease family protein [Spirosoma pollinicola]|uniref:GIY-YIG domain-containing protein n=1 Tax=Spirosoma pollinicola TaxID=2057025 RepID=A0A2K8YX28_9BACT|nr:GIY-YIG nuclease family protein [Spirosoma pollinicola]AUD02173.1 hypothetical protein CWM47_10280 [Spirosoma pollinicola]